ncbi:TetR/AcrR family transcriptional regulator [Ferrimonas pelagia]|uniref:HTH tetR-type domain-containing protein n=1 Tax=Ferrimonas pelagia TaxID=1177826 RepID=A0ABP9F4D8_9GAMM
MKRKRDKTRHNLLAITKNIIQQQGIIGFRLCDISKAANISAGSLYSHFSSKESLLISLYLERLEATIALRKEISQSNLSYYEKILAVNLVLIMFSLHHDRGDGLNFMLANRSLWENAEPALKMQMEGGYALLHAQHVQLWDDARIKGGLLSDNKICNDVRHQLFCYQRGCVVSLQNPMIRGGQEQKTSAHYLEIMINIMRQLCWEPKTDSIDKKHLETHCRTLVDQSDLAII